MKKLLAVLLCATLAFGLSGCGDDSNSGSTGGGGDTSPNAFVATTNNTISSAKAAGVGSSVTVEAVISAFVYNASGKCYTYLTDKTGTFYVHGIVSGNVGDHIIATATVAEYSGRLQLSGVGITSTVKTGINTPLDAAIDTDFAGVTSSLTDLGVNMFKVTCSLDKDSYGNYYLVDADGNKFMNYSSSSDKTEFAFLDEQTGSFTVVVAVQGTSGSGTPRGQVLAIV
ncbi:MAG: hypothetical protein R3Y05_00755 [bacterium]